MRVEIFRAFGYFNTESSQLPPEDASDPLGGINFTSTSISFISTCDPTKGNILVFKGVEANQSAGDGVINLSNATQEMAEAFRKRQKEIEEGTEKVIGVNLFKMEEEHFENIYRTNPEAVRIEQERIKKLKARRDNKKVEELLDKLRRVCEKGENVLPVVMEVTRAGATVGEVCNIYREIWGVWEPPIVI